MHPVTLDSCSVLFSRVTTAIFFAQCDPGTSLRFAILSKANLILSAYDTDELIIDPGADKASQSPAETFSDR